MPSAPLLEREDLLAALAAEPEGRLLLVAGEAGIGKPSLVRAFCAAQRGRVLWGACDALFTPRPLGPFADVAEAAGGELRAVVRAGGRPGDLLPALIAENAEIAERLVLSVRTVEMHVRNVLRKLGAPNRGRARAEAARLGIGA